VNRAVLQRLRAELHSDLIAFGGRAAELRGVRPFPSDAGPCALTAVALHHAYGSIEAALSRVTRHMEGEELQVSHWHQELLEAAALDIPGVRSPLKVAHGCCSPAPHNREPPAGPPCRRPDPRGLTITVCFEAPWRIARLHATNVGPYLDDLSSRLAAEGYAHQTIRGYLRAAEHLATWAARRRIALRSWDDSVLAGFGRHLARCACIKANKGRFDGAVAGARVLLAHLGACGVVAPAPERTRQYAAPVEAFSEWMLRHRGITTGTAGVYRRLLQPFVGALGEDPARYTVSSIRGCVIEHLGNAGRSHAQLVTSAIRAYLRFLVAEGRVRAGLEHSVPTVPHWRLSTLPRCLEAPDVERVLASRDLTTEGGLRDHAILLLLARLSRRGGDIAATMLADIDWRAGSLRVRGKGRRQVRLPLPQDAGDAILAYLERGRPIVETEWLFITLKAPKRPLASPATVAFLAGAALDRAGIVNLPTRGAHLLRHSAATAMLRAGGSLETISGVLRHSSLETTAICAKVDVSMLQQVAQPWPGGARC